MTTTFLQLLVLGPILCLVQLVAALPWLLLIDPRLIQDQVRNRQQLLKVLGITLVVGLGVALYLNANSDPDVMVGWCRVYAAVLQLQLFAGLFIAFFVLLLRFWSKGGAVALST